MKLRCWPGCIAQIVRAHDFPENIGKHVAVIELERSCSVPTWAVKTLSPMWCWDGSFVEYVPAGDEGVIEDTSLRPITPPPDAETKDTPVEIDLPTPDEVALA